MSQSNERGAGRTAEMAAELRVLLGKLSRRLRAEASTSDLTWSQQVLLAQLERQGPITASALARIEGVRPQSISATIASLDVAGLVHGSPDPDDRRQTLFTLTPAGIEMLKVGRAAREDWMFRALQSKLSAEQRDELDRAFRLITRLVE